MKRTLVLMAVAMMVAPAAAPAAAPVLGDGKGTVRAQRSAALGMHAIGEKP